VAIFLMGSLIYNIPNILKVAGKSAKNNKKKEKKAKKPNFCMRVYKRFQSRVGFSIGF
jgi:hypothetical protein